MYCFGKLTYDSSNRYLIKQIANPVLWAFTSSASIAGGMFLLNAVKKKTSPYWSCHVLWSATCLRAPRASFTIKYYHCSLAVVWKPYHHLVIISNYRLMRHPQLQSTIWTKAYGGRMVSWLLLLITSFLWPFFPKMARAQYERGCLHVKI